MVSSIGSSAPHFRRSSTGPFRGAPAPSAITRSTGTGTEARVPASSTWKISASGLPSASVADQPVSDSATAFAKVTRPSASVAITASPMLRRVVE